MSVERLKTFLKQVYFFLANYQVRDSFASNILCPGKTKLTVVWKSMKVLYLNALCTIIKDKCVPNLCTNYHYWHALSFNEFSMLSPSINQLYFLHTNLKLRSSTVICWHQDENKNIRQSYIHNLFYRRGVIPQISLRHIRLHTKKGRKTFSLESDSRRKLILY